MITKVKFNPKLDYQTNTLNVLEDILKIADSDGAYFTALKIKEYKSFFMALAKVSDMEKPSHILFERMMKSFEVVKLVWSKEEVKEAIQMEVKPK